MPKYFIFVTSNHPKKGLTSRDVINERAKQGFYGLSRLSSHQSGDKVLFYLAGDYKFIGVGEITNVLNSLNKEEKKKYLTTCLSLLLFEILLLLS